MIPEKFTKGLIKENPVFVLMLGLCPALAVTTTVYNAIGMAAGTVFVLFFANLLVSLLRSRIPDEIHIPVYIVIIATFVTIVDQAMQAYIPALSKSLGAFVPLIVVNCIILGRAEVFACKNTPKESMIDAVAMGAGFAFSLILIALLRELPGRGSVTFWSSSLWSDSAWYITNTLSTASVPLESGQPISDLNIGNALLLFHQGKIITPLSGDLGGMPFALLVYPAGALFVVGYLKMFFNFLTDEKRKAKKTAAA